MVLFCMLLLPYTIALLFGKNAEQNTDLLTKTKQESVIGQENTLTVIMPKSYGSQEITVEEYLLGCLCGCVLPEYEKEAIKAQAVIMRSEVYAVAKKNNKDKVIDAEILESQLGHHFLGIQKRKELWKSQFPENEKKFLEALEETKGLVIYYENEIISPPYFRLSSGRTRQSELGYLQSVSCEKDLLQSDYLFETTIKNETIKRVLEKNGIIEADDTINLLFDDVGYVKTVEIGGNSISGDSFRKFFDLPSSCFTMIKQEDSVQIVTKGIGHGFGFSQNYANELAKEEEDFLTILHYFFHNIDIEIIV